MIIQKASLRIQTKSFLNTVFRLDCSKTAKVSLKKDINFRRTELRQNIYLRVTLKLESEFGIAKNLTNNDLKSKFHLELTLKTVTSTTMVIVSGHSAISQLKISSLSPSPISKSRS